MKESKSGQRSWRRRIAWVAVAALVCLLLWWLLWWPVMVATRLSGDIAYIEYHPNIDWPARRITDPERIAAFKTWLLLTRRASSLRSAPPMAVCELRVRFRDGHEELMWISATKPALQEGVKGAVGYVDGREMPVEYVSPRSDVRVSWRGRLREGGSTDRFNEILFVVAEDARE